MEVFSLFVQAVGLEIPVDGEHEPIHLKMPEPSIHLPLHDSYVVHHFTELLTDPSFINQSKSNTSPENSQVAVDLNDLKDSPYMRQALSNLIEGSVLNTDLNDNPLETTGEDTGIFPEHNSIMVDNIPLQNQSTWSDELCILKSKTAIIMPAPKWKHYELSVSSVPGATLHVNYLRYWGAIERMIEFLIEIRVLSQLIEGKSYGLLGEIAQTIHETRSQLFSGDIKLDKRLPDLVTQAAYLRHLAALCRSLSHPHLWSRAEYAIKKAIYLLEQMDVPTILEHIERNIASISSVVDHVDELYLADLSEKENDNSTILSIGLAAASLTLTLLMLPSFWADIWVSLGNKVTIWHWVLAAIGTALSILLISGALYMLRIAFIQRKKVKKMFDKFLEGAS